MEKTDLSQSVLLLLCFLGPILFILSFITKLSLVGIVGIIIFAISVSFLLIKSHRTSIEETVADSFLSTFINLNNFLKSLNAKGKGIYFPPKISELNNYVFIPYDDRESLSKLSTIEGIRKRKFLINGGVLLQSTGSSMIVSLEKKFAINFSKLELSNLKETLSTLLVNELGVVDNIYLEILENKIFCMFDGSIFLNLCERIHRELPEFCTKLGCPLCSTIAGIISKITERYVSIEECIVKSGKRKIETTYRLL